MPISYTLHLIKNSTCFLCRSWGYIPYNIRILNLLNLYYCCNSLIYNFLILRPISISNTRCQRSVNSGTISDYYLRHARLNFRKRELLDTRNLIPYCTYKTLNVTYIYTIHFHLSLFFNPAVGCKLQHQIEIVLKGYIYVMFCYSVWYKGAYVNLCYSCAEVFSINLSIKSQWNFEINAELFDRISRHTCEHRSLFVVERHFSFVVITAGRRLNVRGIVPDAWTNVEPDASVEVESPKVFWAYVVTNRGLCHQQDVRSSFWRREEHLTAVRVVVDVADKNIVAWPFWKQFSIRMTMLEWHVNSQVVTVDDVADPSHPEVAFYR